MKRSTRVQIAQRTGTTVAEALFIETALWRRPDPDAYGVESWQVVYSKLPCRILGNDMTTSGEPVDLFAQAGTIRIALPSDTQIFAGDRLTINNRDYDIVDVAHLTTYAIQRIVTARVVVPYGAQSA